MTTDIASKPPTLQMNWIVLGKESCTERRLVFSTKKNKAGSVASSGEAEPRPVSSIAVGDRLQLELKSDMDGYLAFFDFGTSGRLKKLFPCPELATVDNHIEAGRTYTAPGELLPIPAFVVSGPTTAESGRLERLLVIVTRNPVELSEAAVLDTGTAFATRGGFASAEESVASLLDLPEDEWTYGLLEVEVL